MVNKLTYFINTILIKLKVKKQANSAIEFVQSRNFAFDEYQDKYVLFDTGEYIKRVHLYPNSLSFSECKSVKHDAIESILNRLDQLFPDDNVFGDNELEDYLNTYLDKLFCCSCTC